MSIQSGRRKIPRIIDIPRGIEIHVLFGQKVFPFFKALKGSQKLNWNEECQEAFEESKKFLTSPTLLSRPLQGETLYLYICARKETIGTILVRQEEGEFKPIYYINRVLKVAKTMYPEIEKMELIVVITAKKTKILLSKTHCGHKNKLNVEKTATKTRNLCTTTPLVGPTK
ncbi:uncharacterized protein LOC126672343 [Mercurialis annua]|uniref:uncharacterized protein LOC126672343 n=1 Tax=Mercurialis annua TaxID=3986 RepID=UPI00215F6ED8|nr:uncharacterized protein LOC126672343 [Mercurialis annua]